jgi:hypothetical protein
MMANSVLINIQIIIAYPILNRLLRPFFFPDPGTSDVKMTAVTEREEVQGKIFPEIIMVKFCKALSEALLNVSPLRFFSCSTGISPVRGLKPSTETSAEWLGLIPIYKNYVMESSESFIEHS